MSEALPSVEIVAAKVAAERDAQLRHVDAIDAKAGIVLGFSGALVAVSALRVDGLRIAGIVAAVGSGFAALLIFFPRRFPVFDLRRLRDNYLRSDPAFTTLHLLDTEIAMAEQHYAEIKRKASLLKVAIVLLVTAAALSALGIMVAELGE